MDEIIRGRLLVAEILQKAASIKKDMVDVNKGLQRMSLVEEHQRARSAKAQPPKGSATPSGLKDLPRDVLNIIIRSLENGRHIMALSQSCRSLQAVVATDTCGWAARCRLDWGITNQTADSVPRLTSPSTSCRPISPRANAPTPPASEPRLGLSPPDQLEAPDTIPEPKEATRNIWFEIYRERAQGWHHGLQLLRWLQQHGRPSTVSGFAHRQQLNAALRCLALCSGQETDYARRQEVVQCGGVEALLALTRNETSAVQEGALQVLANLAAERDALDARERLMAGSGLGKSLSDMLDGARDAGVVLQAARTLLNMWAVGDCPTVVPLTADGGVASPPLHDGVWVLLEFSMRGDVMSRMPLRLSFDGQSFSGCAVPEQAAPVVGQAPPCVVAGYVDAASGAWTLDRHHPQDQRDIMYRGQSDRHGAFGTYQARSAQGAAAVFFGIRAMGPRVFRLFRGD